LVRIGLCCSLAGIFGALMTFISGRASGARMAEMVGMVGTAGFLGQVLGTQLGDLMLGSESIGPSQIRRMFLVAGGLGCCSVVFAWLATRGQTRPKPHPHPRPPLLQLLRQYHPGPVFIVGVAMGIGLGMPGTFLRTYTDALDIRRIGTFFTVYALTAIVTRVLTRRLPERIGTTPMILCGLGMLAASQFLLMLVRSELWLVVPGVGYGIAHAVLFPSVVAAGSRAFPDRHRGLGTTVILATWDLGTLIGAPMIGIIHHGSTLLGLSPYPMVFLSLAGLLTSVAVFFVWTTRRKTTPPCPIVDTSEIHHEPPSGKAELVEAGEQQ
ncbi:MAG: MFS transporter, partial [Candidatus Nealsonbacteria bacterium]|nr:MFS transporter [Candidatus Nealsonbacteria bacterium]